jgi:hypothetical protein
VALRTKKTVRFDLLIRESGPPVQATLWTKPADDRDFMRAVKEQRVATVIQRNVGTRKDYGVIGFYPEEKSAFFVFPKPLKLPEQTKIIGINYDRLASPAPNGPIYKRSKSKPPGVSMRRRENRAKGAEITRAAAERAAPTLRTFESKVQLKALQTKIVEVEAASAVEAARLVKEKARTLLLELGEAKISRSISKPKLRAGR